MYSKPLKSSHSNDPPWLSLNATLLAFTTLTLSLLTSINPLASPQYP